MAASGWMQDINCTFFFVSTLSFKLQKFFKKNELSLIPLGGYYNIFHTIGCTVWMLFICICGFGNEKEYGVRIGDIGFIFMYIKLL